MLEMVVSLSDDGWERRLEFSDWYERMMFYDSLKLRNSALVRDAPPLQGVQTI